MTEPAKTVRVSTWPLVIAAPPLPNPLPPGERGN